MPKLRYGLIAAIVMIVTVGGSTQGHAEELTAERVNEAIRRGVEFLKSKQDPKRGNWEEIVNQPGGITSLCALALLNCGVTADDPSLSAALDYLRRLGNPESTYSTSLQTMVFCLADPQRDQALIRRNVQWLETAQVGAVGGNDDNRKSHEGGWHYSETGPGGPSDESNSQFAVLALHEASRVGVRASQQTWQRALKYWIQRQDKSGGWRYTTNPAPRGSMTCGGISSLSIIERHLGGGNAWTESGQVVCCGLKQENEAINNGINWLAQNFSVERNPVGRANDSSTHHLYYLYSVERVGRLTGRRFIGKHDWYREGAALLCDRQDGLTGSWVGVTFSEDRREIATAFSLLFLSKGRRPVVVSKLRHSGGDDWNHHANDIVNLTRYVEVKWQRDLNWQIVDVGAANVEDLLQSPVLYLSGRDQLQLTAEQKENLRKYVLNGGFIFAENCCKGQGFDRDFRKLMSELFPETPLRVLPPTHPVWYAEEKVNPKYLRPLLGIDACCRTAVVYCPNDLGCFWEIAQESSELLPERVAAEVDAALSIGANVLAYATNRELRDKLDVPSVTADEQNREEFQRGTLYVAKLDHAGGSDDAPAALRNLLTAFGEQLNTRVFQQHKLLSPTDTTLPDYSVAFMHGREDFRWTEAERQAVAQFVTHGGVIFADAICASKPFQDAFRRELQAALGNQTFERIPPDHPIFTAEYRGFNITEVDLRETGPRATPDSPVETRTKRVTPSLEGIKVNDRYVVIFSPFDISCAMENHASTECTGYVRQDAAKIGINVLLYSLQQ